MPTLRSIDPTVQPLERRQTDTQTDTETDTQTDGWDRERYLFRNAEVKIYVS